MSNEDLEKPLNDLPDQVASALSDWRLSSLYREKCEAMLYISYKAEGTKRTTDEIKAMIRINHDSYEARLREIATEVEYFRLNEKLLCAKKIAGLRSAF